MVLYRFVSISFFFFSSRRRHTRFDCDWSSDVCSSDLFYNGSLPNTQEAIDAASGGSLNNKTLEEAEELIETLASNHYAKNRDRTRKQEIGRASCRERV